MLLLSDQVVVILLVIPRPLLSRPLPPPGSPLLPLVILTVRLLLEHELKNMHLILLSTFGIGLSDLHGGVHKQDEYGHGVDGHEVTHGAPALLLARGLARLTPRVHTRHGPHTRHRALGTHYHYHDFIMYLFDILVSHRMLL